MVEPIELPSHEEREAAFEHTGYNAFSLDVHDVYIDPLTDSGTGVMPTEQWTAIIRGDEAYIGSESFARLAELVRDAMGFEHVMPTHQGRGAKNILYGVLLEDGDVVPNNPHPDTIRAYVVNQGVEPVDCPSSAVRGPDPTETFKGNSDIDAGYALVEEAGANAIPAAALTIMNNSAAGQPVSMVDIRVTTEFIHDIDAMLVIDICRSAENAHSIKTHEAGYEDHSIAEIARTQFKHVDVITMSGRKNALANIGGLATMRDEAVFEYARQRAVLYEGFPIYGGLLGHDIEAMAVGLHEAVTPSYVTDRAEWVAELDDLLVEISVPVYQPTGGYVVYLDAGEVLPHIPKEEFPGQELVCALYLEGGARGVELGGFAFPGIDRPDLVCLTLSRRTYSREHFEHVAETATKVMTSAGEYGGLGIVVEPPMKEPRHFSSRPEPVSN